GGPGSGVPAGSAGTIGAPDAALGPPPGDRCARAASLVPTSGEAPPSDGGVARQPGPDSQGALPVRPGMRLVSSNQVSVLRRECAADRPDLHTQTHGDGAIRRVDIC